MAIMYDNYPLKVDNKYIVARQIKKYPRDWFRFCNFIIETLYIELRDMPKDQTIFKLEFDHNDLCKYDLPFDVFSITICEDDNLKNDTSYIYVIGKDRVFDVCLYYEPSYFYDILSTYCFTNIEVFYNLILREMNNCFNRDIYKNDCIVNDFITIS